EAVGEADGRSGDGEPAEKQVKQAGGTGGGARERSQLGVSVGLVLVAVLVVGLGAAVGALSQSRKGRKALVDFLAPELVTAVEDWTGLELAERGFRGSSRFPIYAQDAVPPEPVLFSVHFNGDGSGAGEQVSSADFEGLNEFIRETCGRSEQVAELVDGDAAQVAQMCDPDQGARVFTHTGRRAHSFLDIEQGSRVYLVPQGLQFVWPLGEVGEYFYPEAVESPLKDAPIRLRQLSKSVRVFTVENFMSEEEMEAILEHNRDLLQPSEVGFAGWRDATRTSSTAWDFHSWASRKIQRRSFDLLGMEFAENMADAVQVLRYNLTEWYKPHTDWFDGKAYDGHDPRQNNGTNRFATVFLYLTDVEEGGHTVFPLSTTHEGYNGEQLVHPGTEKTPGYIAQRDAEWVCNTSSTALRSEPKAGTAVLFYSQLPDGTLDRYSLHGGCPVIKGLKYSANVWIWNRPKPSKENAKDGGKKSKPANNNQIGMQFHNARDTKVNLYWDDGTEDMVFQVEIEPGFYSPMSTYHGHRFVARDAETNEEVFSFVAKDEMKGEEFVAHIE
ncbi:Probable prolyl 4-hydroxylase 9 (AtP4H9), partial [Durusdinium trenchii]